MGDEQKDNLQFELKLDIPQFQQDWNKTWEKNIQTIIDRSKFHIKLDINKAQLDSIKSTLTQLQSFGVGGVKNAKTGAYDSRMVIANAKAAQIAAESEAKLTNERTRGATANNQKTASEKALQASEQRLITATNAATRSELQLTAAKSRGIAATHTQNKAYQAQRGVLNGLPQMVNSYLSILGGIRFVTNIRDVTGQYELQRVALGAIIQDAERASRLFDEIKAKAVKSPFTVMDMATFTKQLAAFKVPTEELYSTMNMLADISAGLGVGMDRLILAYGQVKAASVLRGQELRQFTEAGIPLVQLLADKFTALNGELVTTGQVFKLISQRAVPFTMVKEVFEDMTSAGGAFFNMQEVQAKTLYGMWMNLTDAIQIMEDEMGRANRGVLMTAAKVARELALNWRTVTAVVSPLVAAIIAYNVVIRAAAVHETFFARTTILLTNAQQLKARAVNMSTAGHMREAIALRSSAAATILASRANNGLTRTFYLLRASMLANPITWWITALTTAAAVIYSIVSHRNAVERMNTEISETASRIKASADVSAASLDGLMTKLKNAKQGSQEYADTVDEINRRYGSFLPEQLKVAQSYDSIAASIKGVTVAIMEQARAKTYTTGIEKIEGKFADQISGGYDKALKALQDIKKLKLSESAAGGILENIKQALAGGETNIGSVIKKALGDSYKKAGIDFGAGLSNNVLRDISKGVKDMTAPSQSLAIATEALNEKVNTLYGSTKGYEKELKAINDEYTIQDKKLRETLSVEKYAIASKELSTQRLKDQLALYKQFNQMDLFHKTEIELQKLSGVAEDWVATVDKITEGKGTFTVGEEEDYFDYIKRLRSAYKSLREQEKDMAGAPTSEINNITAKISQLRALASGLGISISSKEDKSGLKAEQDALKDILDMYGNKIDLIERYTKVYEKMLALTGDEKKSAEMALTITGLNMSGKNIEDELRKQVKDIFAKLNLSYSPTISMESLRNEIGKLDPNGKEFKSAESALNKLSDYMTETEVSAGELEKKIAELSGEDFILTGTGADLDMSKITSAATKAYAKIADERKKMEIDAASLKQQKGDEWYNTQMQQIANIYDTKLANEEKLTKEEIDNLNWKEFQKLTKYAAAFEDMGRVGRGTLAALAGDLQRMIDSGENSAAMMMLFAAQLKKIKAIQEQENPFLALANGLQEYNEGLKEAADTGVNVDAFNAGLDKMKSGLDKIIDSVKNMDSQLQTIIQPIDDSIALVENLGKAFGVTFSDETQAAITAFKTGVSLMSDALKVVNSTMGAYKTITEAVNAAKAASVAASTVSVALLAAEATGEVAVGTAAAAATPGIVAMGAALWVALTPLLPYIAALAVIAGIIVAVVQSRNAEIEVERKRLLAAIAYNEQLRQEYEWTIKIGEAKLGYYKREGEELVKQKKANEEAQIAIWRTLIPGVANPTEEDIKNGYNQLAEASAEGRLSKGAEELFQTLKILHDEGIDIDNMILKWGEDMREAFTGTTYDSLVSSIVDGFKAGKRSAADFADTFEQLMKGAVQATFALMVDENMREWYVKFANFNKASAKLSPEERARQLAELRAEWLALNAKNAQDATDLENATGYSVLDTNTSLTGMSKSVAGMSEDAAKTFGAYLNSGLMQWVQQTNLQKGMSTTLTDLYGIQNQALTALNAIKSNTDQLVINTAESVNVMKSVLSGTGAKSMRVQLI